jgi:hypothetical protein
MDRKGILWVVAIAIAGAIATGAVGVSQAKDAVAVNATQSEQISELREQAAANNADHRAILREQNAQSVKLDRILERLERR